MTQSNKSSMKLRGEPPFMLAVTAVKTTATIANMNSPMPASYFMKAKKSTSPMGIPYSIYSDRFVGLVSTDQRDMGSINKAGQSVESERKSAALQSGTYLEHRSNKAPDSIASFPFASAEHLAERLVPDTRSTRKPTGLLRQMLAKTSPFSAGLSLAQA